MDHQSGTVTSLSIQLVPQEALEKSVIPLSSAGLSAGCGGRNSPGIHGFERRQLEQPRRPPVGAFHRQRTALA